MEVLRLIYLALGRLLRETKCFLEGPVYHEGWFSVESNHQTSPITFGIGLLLLMLESPKLAAGPPIKHFASVSRGESLIYRKARPKTMGE